MNAAMEQMIAREAGSWVFRLREDASPQCRTEFETWLKTSPGHVAQFLLATAMEVELGGLEGTDQIDLDRLLAESQSNIVPLAAAAGPEPRHPPRRSGWAIAAAASLAATVIAFALWPPNTYETGVGEQRALKLEDGSMVQLNTRSRIEVRYSREARVIRLLEGEALFTVASEKTRPFTVESDATWVRALGTQFNVYRQYDGAKVSVVEGRVQISTASAGEAQSPPAVVLEAGQEAEVERSGRVVKSPEPQIAHTLAWRQRHLEFHSATVAQVATEFNRYNRLQIHVADEVLANRKMSGLFAADEPQSLIDFLADEGGIHLERHEGTVVLSSAR